MACSTTTHDHGGSRNRWWRPRWRRSRDQFWAGSQATDLWEARQLAAARSPPSPLHGEEDDSNQMVWGLQGFLVVGGMVVVVGRIARVVG